MPPQRWWASAPVPGDDAPDDLPRKVLVGASRARWPAAAAALQHAGVNLHLLQAVARCPYSHEKFAD